MLRNNLKASIPKGVNMLRNRKTATQPRGVSMLRNLCARASVKGGQHAPKRIACQPFTSRHPLHIYLKQNLSLNYRGVSICRNDSRKMSKNNQFFTIFGGQHAPKYPGVGAALWILLFTLKNQFNIKKQNTMCRMSVGLQKA